MQVEQATMLYNWLTNEHGFDGTFWSIGGFNEYRVGTVTPNGMVIITEDLIAFYKGDDWDEGVEPTREIDLDVFGPDGYRDLVRWLQVIDFLPDAAQEAEFVDQYVSSALWTERTEWDDDGQHLDDAGYDIDDLSDELLAQVKADVENFLRDNAHLIKFAELVIDPKYTFGQAAHDFWLTRNHHGAGFWDRGLWTIGDRLTERAQHYGETSWYVGDDGKVYGE